MRRLFILVILLVGLLIFVGCSNDDSSTILTLTVSLEVDGEPVEGEVTVDGETKTGSVVEFQLINGTYTVEASADGYDDISKEVVIDGEDSSLGIEFITYDATIILQDKDGNPVNKEVSINGQSKTGSEVEFQLANGTYMVEVSADGYVGDFDKEITIDGEDASFIIEIKTSTVSINLKDRDGNPIEGKAIINGQIQAGSEVEFQLANGTYVVDVSHDEYINRFEEIEINGADTSLDIKLNEEAVSKDNYTLKNGDELLGNTDYPAISHSGFRTDERSDATAPSVEDLKEDMKILEAMGIKLLRTYNTTDFPQTERLLQAIDELKRDDSDFEMYVMIGAWVQCENAYTYGQENHYVGDTEWNRAEIDKAIEFANDYPDIVKIIAVGNEAMVHWQPHHVTPDIILRWVNYLRNARANGDVSEDILITSSDNYAPWGGEDHYKNSALKELVKAVDFVSLHTYPFHDTHYNDDFWKVPAEDADLDDTAKIENAMERAINYAKNQYDKVADYVHSIAPDKSLHIGETGWATISTDHYGISESKAADEYKSKIYYDAMREWSEEKGITNFYFQIFDEPWKGGPNEGHSEKNFGLFTVDGQAKYPVWDLVEEGTFEGLTRDGNEIEKTYKGDKAALMDDVLVPPEK